jgi:hypothetical protein
MEAPFADERPLDAPGLPLVNLILDLLEGNVLLDFWTGASSGSGVLKENLKGFGLKDRGRDGASAWDRTLRGEMVTLDDSCVNSLWESDSLFTF